MSNVSITSSIGPWRDGHSVQVPQSGGGGVSIFAHLDKSDRARFAAKVAPPNDRGCHLWTASKLGGDGYGQFVLTTKGGASRKSLHLYAHRVAWVIANGRDIPKGLQVCHRCDVPGCVNPDHFFLGDQAENLRDARNKGRPIGRQKKPALPPEAWFPNRAEKIAYWIQQGKSDIAAHCARTLAHDGFEVLRSRERSVQP